MFMRPKKPDRNSSNRIFLATTICFLVFCFGNEYEYGIADLLKPVILVLLIFGVCKRRKENKRFDEQVRQYEAKQYAFNPDNEEIKRLIDEAVYVINCMLESGLAASLYSDGFYEGFILTLPETRNGFVGNTNVGNYGFEITMHQTPDLKECRDKYRRRFSSAHWSEINSQLDIFLRIFENYYVVSSEQYIYKTKNTASLLHNDRMRLKAYLYEQIELRCPLADFSGTPIHTKNVARS